MMIFDDTDFGDYRLLFDKHFYWKKGNNIPFCKVCDRTIPEHPAETPTYGSTGRSTTKKGDDQQQKDKQISIATVNFPDGYGMDQDPLLKVNGGDGLNTIAAISAAVGCTIAELRAVNPHLDKYGDEEPLPTGINVNLPDGG